MKIGKFKQRKGMAIVEFAIIAPLLITILLGIVDASIFLYNQHVITNASREAARLAIVKYPDGTTTPDADINSMIENYTNNFLISFGPIAVTPPDIDPPYGERAVAAFGTPVTVKFDFTYKSIFIPQFNTTLTHSTTMLKE